MNCYHLEARKIEPNLKLGMRSGAKKDSKSRIHDSRVYSYDELIEYRPRREDLDDDSYWFNLEDTKMEI